MAKRCTSIARQKVGFGPITSLSPSFAYGSPHLFPPSLPRYKAQIVKTDR